MIAPIGADLVNSVATSVNTKHDPAAHKRRFKKPAKAEKRRRAPTEGSAMSGQSDKFDPKSAPPPPASSSAEHFCDPATIHEDLKQLFGVPTGPIRERCSAKTCKDSQGRSLVSIMCGPKQMLQVTSRCAGSLGSAQTIADIRVNMSSVGYSVNVIQQAKRHYLGLFTDKL